MKTILCYGDSNTWGQNSESEERYPRDIRWTGRLANIFRGTYDIAEHGLCGRTTIYDLPLEENRNGYRFLPVALSTVDPIDLVILMLGTNDRRIQLAVSPQESALAIEKYIHMIRTPEHWFGHKTPKILIVSPPGVKEEVMETECGFYYDTGSVNDSKALPIWYQKIAQKYHCDFLDAALYGEVGSDCVHLSAKGHRKLAEALAEKIQQITF